MTVSYDYQWSHSPEQEAQLRAEGFEYAGESGRYPSRLMRRLAHCGRCSATTQETLSDLGKYTEICREGKE